VITAIVIALVLIAADVTALAAVLVHAMTDSSVRCTEKATRKNGKHDSDEDGRDDS
jgi:hypothetical protein